MQLRHVKDIEYQLLPGADRQTTDIVIERDGMITVRPPQWMTPEQVDETVFSKRMWIYKNLAEWRDLNAIRIDREWVNGESFLYLGSRYQLRLVDQQDEALKLKDGRFCLLNSVPSQQRHKVFQDFYSSKGLARISARVGYFADKVGVKPGKVIIKDIGYRWASCLKNSDLHFHWKCLMAPLTIIDYIVVHELCHLHYRDHSTAFWNEVDKVLPDYQQRKTWLRERGAELAL